MILLTVTLIVTSSIKSFFDKSLYDNPLQSSRKISISRFDNRDRAFVIAQFICLTMTLMAVILGLTDMTYYPRLIWKPISPLTILFYAGYTVLCLMPLGLELWTEYQFKKARENI